MTSAASIGPVTTLEPTRGDPTLLISSAGHWGDGYNPPAGDDPIDPARTPEYGIDLYRNITERNLSVERIAPAHGAGARPFDNLRKAIGVIPAS